MQLYKLTNFLNNLLDNKQYKDDAINGLQVENNGLINKIFTAVDANLHTIRQCENNSLLIVHHGLFWGNQFPVTGVYYEKIKTLISANVALYASHLPLDAHAEVGNNIQLLRQMGAEITGSFGEYHGATIGFKGEFDDAIEISEAAQRLQRVIQADVRIFSFSAQKKIKKICAVSGDPGMKILEEYKNSGIDLMITGESSHILYNYMEDNQLNLLCGWHYATETLGVKALGQ